MLTTGISLVRENTASLQPPRALWVSFPLGRPLGKPGDASFQQGVIQAALDLLHRKAGPVLEDYPHDAPAVDDGAPTACPVSFATDNPESTSWKNRLTREIGELAPWYELGRRRRGGRSLVGIANASPEQNIARLGEHLDNNRLPTDIVWLKHAVEDIRAFYVEAMTAQPGDYDPQTIQNQFWRETQFGAAVLELYHQFRRSDDNRQKEIARILAPREAVQAATNAQRETPL